MVKIIYIFQIQVLIHFIIFKYFFLFYVFSISWWCLLKYEVFRFGCFNFYLLLLTFLVRYHRTPYLIQTQKRFSCVLFWSCIVFILTFRLKNHLELTSYSVISRVERVLLATFFWWTSASNVQKSVVFLGVIIIKSNFCGKRDSNDYLSGVLLKTMEE